MSDTEESIKLELSNIFENLSKDDADLCCVNQIRKCLQNGADVNCMESPYSKTLLHEAAFQGKLKVVEFLLSQEKINVNACNSKSQTALHKAVYTGHEEIAKRLLEHADIDTNARDIYNCAPLHVAVKRGHEGLVKLLLKHEQFDSSVWSGWTPLHAAVDKGFVSLAEILLTHKQVDVNTQDKDGSTALHDACKKGNPEFIDLFLQRNEINLNLADNREKTPLHIALELQQLECAKRLLKRPDLDVTAKIHSNGRTLLHMISERGHEDLARMFLEHKRFDINAKDRIDVTPLQLSVMMNHFDLSTLLQGAGGKIFITEKSVKRAIDCPEKEKSNSQIFDAMRDYGEWEEETVENIADIAVAMLKTDNEERTKQMFDALFLQRLTDFELEKLLIKKVQGLTVFSHYCKHQQTEIIKDILKRTRKPLNKGDPSPFWLAASSGNLEMVKFLANFPHLDYERPSIDGTTPLVVAFIKSRKGKVDTFTKVQDHIASLIEQNNGSKLAIFKQMIAFGLGEHLKPASKNILQKFLKESGIFVKKSFLTCAIESDSRKTVDVIVDMLQDDDDVLSDPDIIDSVKKRCLAPLFTKFKITIPPESQLSSDCLKLSNIFPVLNENIEETWYETMNDSVDSIDPKLLDAIVLNPFCCFPTPITNNDVSKMELQMCAKDCIQQENCSRTTFMVETCQRMNAILSQRKSLMRTLAPKFHLIGSIAEGTRLCTANEMDVTIECEGLKAFPFFVDDDACQLLVHQQAKEGILNEFLIEGTDIFDYPKFQHFLHTEIKESLIEMGYPEEYFDMRQCEHKCTNDCTPNCKHNDCKPRLKSLYQPKRHCFEQNLPVDKEIAMLTHTRIGPCVILQHAGKILTIDMVPVFPVCGKNTMQLFNTVVKTLIEEKPSYWRRHFEQLLKRDVFLPEVYDNIKCEKENASVLVAIKLINYGPRRNYIIRPGQEMALEEFKDDNLKSIYTWMKALKGLFNIDAKSFFMKKVVLLPGFVEDCRTSMTNVEDSNRTKTKLGLLKRALEHPDLKPAFQERFDFEKPWNFEIPLRRMACKKVS